tara:strand:+ start:6260 stop:7369 length:1110 start_codon:yes stop_codon:yes gene_type:complete
MSEINDQIIKLTHALEKTKSKESALYFLTMDTKGHAKASVALIYDIVKELINAGYNANIMHEKEDFQDVTPWLGDEYKDIPHVSIESKQVQVNICDLVIIPEVFGHVLEQTQKMPCEKIILSQAYDYVLETLPPGMAWRNYGVNTCITTSAKQKDYLQPLMGTLEYLEVTPFINDSFKKYEYPQPPLISIHTREPRDTMKIIKSFYLKFPQFKWITFRDLRNLPRKKFAEDLSESFVSIWVDDISGFGTFPLESMKCGVPVIGKVPNLKPEWMTEENGIWPYEFNQIVDILGNFVQKWLEDDLPKELYGEMEEISKKYSKENFKTSLLNVFNSINERKTLEFRRNLEKLTPVGPQDSTLEGSVNELYNN